MHALARQLAPQLVLSCLALSLFASLLVKLSLPSLGITFLLSFPCCLSSLFSSSPNPSTWLFLPDLFASAPAPSSLLVIFRRALLSPPRPLSFLFCALHSFASCSPPFFPLILKLFSVSNQYDTTRDGFISLEELKYMMEKLEAPQVRARPHHFTEVLRQIPVSTPTKRKGRNPDFKTVIRHCPMMYCFPLTTEGPVDLTLTRTAWLLLLSVRLLFSCLSRTNPASCVNPHQSCPLLNSH